jgi:hypothetical protein
MSAEVAPLFAKTLRVRFTQPSDLNDPFELRPFIDFEATAEELHEVVGAKVTKMYATADDALSMMEKQQASDPNYPKMLVPIPVFRKMIAANPLLGEQFMELLSQDKAEVLEPLRKAAVWEAQWEKFRQIFGQFFGIFSLTEDPVHILMWSHYASQHSGIAVEFDELHPWFDQKLALNDEFRHLVQVAYVKNPSSHKLSALSGAEVLYTKADEWAYEREWRIVLPLKNGTEVSPGKFCFDVPASAVRSIIFGCRTTPALEKEIRDSITANPALNHVCFGKVVLKGSGKIEIANSPIVAATSRAAI